MRTVVRRGVVAVLGAATVLTVAAPAQAAVGGHVNVGVDGNLKFTGEPNVVNAITVTKTGTGTVPTPPVGDVALLATSDAEAEQWEGVPITPYGASRRAVGPPNERSIGRNE